ncbi:ABC transporter permease [Salipiger abyssi]|uniref:ABC transporter permease n=1 Tax=Salipiger abyssi TaxID=1250539 RepID=UPI001A8CEF66|nr:ABC transporter permease [Salipiger abyssi]MBN9885787.1 ABC transporter permease [Salipiger abyssi]
MTMVKETKHIANPPRGGGSVNWTEFFERSGLILLLLLVITVFAILRPNTFATYANFRSIATVQPVMAVTAIALIVPLIGGRFDVSVGATLGLSAIVTASAMSHFQLPLAAAIGLGVLSGALIGAVNGTIVAYLGVNSIIGTLGIATILGGVVTGYTNGIPISSGLSPILTDISIQSVLGIPVLFILMAVIAVAVWFVLTQTPYGRNLAAVGANADSARLAGIRSKRVVMQSFVIAGALAGIAGVLQIGAQGNAGPQLVGITFILPALAAAFLGATTWQPGRFTVQGTIIGIFFLGTTISGLSLVGIQPWITDVFNGAAVVLAIALSAQLRRRRTGSLDIGS